MHLDYNSKAQSYIHIDDKLLKTSYLPDTVLSQARAHLTKILTTLDNEKLLATSQGPIHKKYTLRRVLSLPMDRRYRICSSPTGNSLKIKTTFGLFLLCLGVIRRGHKVSL
jgi:hypothetical protein